MCEVAGTRRFELMRLAKLEISPSYFRHAVAVTYCNEGPMKGAGGCRGGEESFESTMFPNFLMPNLPINELAK